MIYQDGNFPPVLLSPEVAALIWGKLHDKAAHIGCVPGGDPLTKSERDLYEALSEAITKVVKGGK